MSVFEASLRMRMKLEKMGIDTQEQAKYQRIRIAKGDKTTAFAQVLDEEAKNVPSWFTRSRDDWKRLLEQNSDLAFNPLFTNATKARKDPNVSIDDSLPDWYKDLSGGIPTTAIVKEEIAQDKDAISTHEKIGKIIEHQAIYLSTQLENKVKKSAAFFETRRRQVLQSLETFEDMIIFLGATRDMDVYELTPEGTCVSTESLSPEEARKETIAFFTHEDRVYNKHTIVLWIESKLREGGIASNVQATLEGDMTSLLSSLFPEIPHQNQVSRFGDLQTTNKKAFNALNYDIAPLTDLLSQDEKAYMRELIKIYKEDSVEAFVWDMSDLISARLIDTSDVSTLPNQTAITLRHVREFTGKWLRNNWEWAHRQIRETISKKQMAETEEEKDTPLPNEVTVIEPKTGTTDKETNQHIEEIEEAIAEVRKSNLGRYKLFYKFDRDDPLDRAIPIKGESLDEFSDTLANIIGRYGISCSVKPSSIINSLDHLLELSPADREKATRITLDGKLHHRAKRQGVRIFFDLLEDDGIFAINIYQKQAQEYKR